MLPFTVRVNTKRENESKAIVSTTAAGPAISIGFRSRPEDAFWHFCENCPEWPNLPEPFDERAGPLPEGSELCTSCLEIRQAGNCRLRAAASGFTR